MRAANVNRKRLAMYHPERVHDRAKAYIDAKDYSAVEWHIEQGGTTAREPDLPDFLDDQAAGFSGRGDAAR